MQLVLFHLRRTERVALIADLLEVSFGELVGIDDDDPAGAQIGEVRLERRGIHRDEHIRAVTGGENVVVGDLDLEARHPVQRALRRADLRREVRLRRQVVTEGCRFGRELVAGELHSVAGITRDADDDLVELGLRPFTHLGASESDRATLCAADHNAIAKLTHVLVLFHRQTNQRPVARRAVGRSSSRIGYELCLIF